MPSQNDRLVVLSSPYPIGDKPNQTVMMLVDSLPTWVEVRPFHLKTAILGRYSLLHWHWPEAIVRGLSRWQRAKRISAVPFLALRLRISKTPVVLTVHNEKAHETGPILERIALRLLHGAVTHRVFMYSAALANATEGQTVDKLIPRGDYAPLYADSFDPRFSLIKKGMLIIPGHPRPYKGIEEFLRTFSELGGREFRLRIVGRPLSSIYGSELRESVQQVPGVELETSYLSDADLEREILESEVVVLPYWRVYNSGVALLALTLKRPIIVQDSPTMRELADEVGGNWVTRISFPATPQTFREAYSEALKAYDGPLPSLKDRDWNLVGQRYAELYAEAAGL
jgi:beta-1,4-mannosyltransferase